MQKETKKGKRKEKKEGEEERTTEVIALPRLCSEDGDKLILAEIGES